MTSISTLPPELLSHIFLCALAEQRWSGWTSTRSPYSFSQVCQSWRAVALGEPKLWRDLTLSRPTKRWTQELIRRSQGANMIVYVSSSSPEEAQTVAGKYIHRIEDLKLLGMGTDSFLGAQHGEQGPTDEEFPLRSLHVSTKFTWLSDELPTHTYPTPLDQDVSTIISRSPKLDELALSDRANLVWSTRLPPNLTKLKISRAERTTLKQFLAALRQSPRLEYLILSECCPKDDEGELPPPATNKIDLLHLKNLNLEPIDLETQSFFRYLNVPPKRIVLSCQNGPNQPTPLPVTQYLSDRSCDPDVRFRWPTLTQLTLTALPSQFLINAWLRPEPIRSESFYEWKEETNERYLPLQIYLQFQWGNGASNFPIQRFLPFFGHLCQGLPLYNLQVLCLSGVGLDYITPELFSDLLNNLPELIFLKSSASRHLLWQNLWVCHKETKKRKTRTSTPAICIPLPKLRYISAAMEPTFSEPAAEQQRARGLFWMRRWLRARLASSGLKLRWLEFTSWKPFSKTNPGFTPLVDAITYTRDE